MKSLLSSKPRVLGFLALALACFGLLLMGRRLGVANPQQVHALADNPSPTSDADSRRFSQIRSDNQRLSAFVCVPKDSSSGQTTTYYVSPDGDDNNPGTEAQPWRTIQKAAEALVAGDTVYIKEGTYHERVIPQNSGTPGNYIVYAAYPGHTVTIDGAGITLPQWWGGLFDISNKSYIKVSGLRIINAGPHLNNVGILVDSSSHIIIEGNYTYNTTSSGIGVWGSDNVIIDNNEVELACNDGEQESITVAGTDTFEVRNNHVHHGGPGTNGGEGIDVKDGSSNGKVFNNHVHHMNRVGIYVDAWDKHTYNIEVFGNVVHDNADDGFALASEMGGLLENVAIYNNIAYNNRWCGLTLSECCSANRPVHNVKIINNTFYDNGWSSWGGGIVVANPDVENVVIRNNIASQNLSFQIAVNPGVPMGQLSVDHNLIDGYRGNQEEGEIYGDDYVEGDPLFVNPTGADFHLQDNSPAIDQGSPTDAPSDDFEGDARPYGAGVDIGADEWVGCVLDGDVDIADIMLVAARWHTAVGDPDYNPDYDLDGNGVIDIVDIMLVAVHWGESCGTGVDKWSLWTEGTQLRGANIWQRRVYPELDGTEFLGSGPVGPPYVQSDFDNLAALGANYVNISHPGLFTEDPPYVLDQESGQPAGHDRASWHVRCDLLPHRAGPQRVLGRLGRGYRHRSRKRVVRSQLLQQHSVGRPGRSGRLGGHVGLHRPTLQR